MTGKRNERPPILVPLAGAAILLFLLGTAVAHFRWPPYPEFLAPAFLALEARIERRALTTRVSRQDHWRPARISETGVTRHDPARSAGGYTLYTSAYESAAFLLDEGGRVLHEWRLPFREAWPDAPHVADPVDEERIMWVDAVAYPDGSVAAIYHGSGDTPYGYGLVKVDRESNVMWRLPLNAHHHLELLEDRSLLTLVHEFRDREGPGAPPAAGGDSRLLEDAVLHVSAEGEVLDRLNLVDAFLDSDFRWVLESTFLQDDNLPGWDILHANAARPVGPEFARHHPWVEPGMILVSLRSPSLLAIVDPVERKVIWASRGLWRFQHDPLPLPDGDILLFDNFGFAGAAAGRSRVVQVDPVTGAASWTYGGTPADPLFSEFSSRLQVLHNGNVLIVEFNAGRMLEITRSGDIVWEFWNPSRTEIDGVEHIAGVFSGRRYAPEELPFLGR